MTARHVADSLNRDELRVLQQLRDHRGSISGTRAFELRIRRDVVDRLRQKAAVEIEDATGDLQLTTAGHDLLTLRCPDTNGDHDP